MSPAAIGVIVALVAAVVTVAVMLLASSPATDDAPAPAASPAASPERRALPPRVMRHRLMRNVENNDPALITPPGSTPAPAAAADSPEAATDRGAR